MFTAYVDIAAASLAQHLSYQNKIFALETVLLKLNFMEVRYTGGEDQGVKNERCYFSLAQAMAE